MKIEWDREYWRRFWRDVKILGLAVLFIFLAAVLAVGLYKCAPGGPL